jgi:hypothetical protein
MKLNIEIKYKHIKYRLENTIVITSPWRMTSCVRAYEQFGCDPYCQSNDIELRVVYDVGCSNIDRQSNSIISRVAETRSNPW